MAPIRIYTLNAWSAVDGTVWEGFGSYDLIGRGMLLEVGFEVSKGHIIPR